MTTLIIAEHDNQRLGAATLSVVTAAQVLGSPIHILVAGSGCQSVAQEAALVAGVQRVLLADGPAHERVMAESLADQIQGLADGYGAILFASTTTGKNVAPRLAALLDVSPLSDITKIISANTFERPIYAGNVIATVETQDTKLVATVRPTSFEAAPTVGGAAPIDTITAVDPSISARFVSQELSKSDRPELVSARVVVSGGRALGSAEQYQSVLTPLADKLNAALGASRAAVDAGYAPNDYQVGQTGKVVAPELYIAIGMSGAIQHLAGMKDSKVIVAINKDPDAPIFQVADYGLVADLFEALPQLVEKL